MAYKTQNTHIDVFFIYVGNKEVESVHKTNESLNDHAILQKQDVANMVRSHQYLNNTKYKLISLLKYNITLDAEDISALANSETNETHSAYLQSAKHIDDIQFDDTLDFLQETNALFFVYSRDYKARDKRETKRIMLNSKLRKTKRGWKQT